VRNKIAARPNEHDQELLPLRWLTDSCREWRVAYVESFVQQFKTTLERFVASSATLLVELDAVAPRDAPGFIDMKPAAARRKRYAGLAPQ
jgi:hypothetical protein